MSEAILKTKLTGDSAELRKSFKEALEAGKEFTHEMGEQIKETLFEVSALVIGIGSIGAALEKTFEGVKGIFELGEDLGHMADRTGLTIKELVQLQTEFKLTGLGADQVGSTINRMQRSIENAYDTGGKAAEVYGNLGLNLEALQGMSAAEQFDSLRKSIASIEDPARKTQAVMAIFGKQGGELLGVFGDKELHNDASNALGQQSDALARNAELFAQVKGQIETAYNTGGKAADIYGSLGINLKALQTMSPAAQFDTLRKSIESIEDPARKVQTAMAMFGKQGEELLSAFGNKELEGTASSALGGQADVIARNAELFAQVQSQIETSGVKMQGFFVGLADPLAKVLLPILKQINSINLMDWGEKIGAAMADAVRVLYNAFEDGKLGQLVSLTMRVAFEEAVGWLIGAMQGVGTAFYDIFDLDFATHLSNIFDGVALQFGAAILNAFSSPISALQAALNYNIDLGRAKHDEYVSQKNAEKSEKEADYYGSLRAGLMEQGPNGLDRVRPGFEKKAEQYERAGAGFARDAANQRAEQEKNANIGKMSYSEYITNAAAQPATFFGATSENMRDKGKAMIEEGTSGMDTIVKRLMDKIAEDMKNITPSGLKQTEADKKELADLWAKLNKPIPGEGKSKDMLEDHGRRGGGRDWGNGELQGISQGNNGQWSYFSSNGQGAISLGNQGSAGRAGRIEANPDGKGPTEILSDMDKHLKHIDDQLSSITAPA